MKIARVDRLGRIVIPVQDRRALGLGEGSTVEIVRRDKEIVLSAHGLSCGLCGVDIPNDSALRICASCIGLVKNMED